jgi:hypothetical protein
MNAEIQPPMGHRFRAITIHNCSLNRCSSVFIRG